MDCLGVEGLFWLNIHTQRWESFIVGAPAFVPGISRLDHRAGVFITLRPSETALAWSEPGFIASASGSERISAPPGWSTLGYVGPAGVTPAALASDASGVTFFGWDGAAQGWLTYGRNRPAFANTLVRVDPLQGLIIKNDAAIAMPLHIPEAP
ncbi:MAG: hypothetical protein O3B31_14600 [Chloroflexi bacterium]|nr:hypothetical protein [Chloroflexota bacterium]MDA1004552.1 hypothetical protein [Chloroflexota bacterium]